VTAAPDGRIYVIGGVGTGLDEYLSLVEVYDPIANSWARVADMPTARQALATALGPDGRIYAFGGASSPPFLQTVEAYDPGADSWSTGAPMPTPRTGIAAATGSNGLIYVFGGAVFGGLTDAVEAYDPVADAWRTVASMPTARWYMAAAPGVDGNIYVIGGTNASGFPDPRLDIVESYDPLSDTWTTAAPMPTRRSHLGTAAGPDGLIYAIGGRPDDLTEEPRSRAAEVYDPIGNVWTAIDRLRRGRSDFGAAAGIDGRIYAIGGDFDRDMGPSTVEAY
jgi:N-acetylneuraminic acid mutarotase